MTHLSKSQIEQCLIDFSEIENLAIERSLQKLIAKEEGFGEKSTFWDETEVKDDKIIIKFYAQYDTAEKCFESLDAEELSLNDQEWEWRLDHYREETQKKKEKEALAKEERKKLYDELKKEFGE